MNLMRFIEMRKTIKNSMICLGLFTSLSISDVATWPIGGVVVISEHII